jgi:hypothetical protein
VDFAVAEGRSTISHKSPISIETNIFGLLSEKIDLCDSGEENKQNEEIEAQDPVGQFGLLDLTLRLI